MAGKDYVSGTVKVKWYVLFVYDEHRKGGERHDEVLGPMEESGQAHLIAPVALFSPRTASCIVKSIKGVFLYTAPDVAYKKEVTVGEIWHLTDEVLQLMDEKYPQDMFTRSNWTCSLINLTERGASWYKGRMDALDQVRSTVYIPTPTACNEFRKELSAGTAEILSDIFGQGV